MSTYFDSNACPHSMHYFLRDDDDLIVVFHGDDSECTISEHSFAEMRNDEVERVYSCPQCDKRPADDDHIRKCIGYSTPLSKAEVLDAYSDPTDSAKREAMLATLSEG